MPTVTFIAWDSKITSAKDNLSLLQRRVGADHEVVVVGVTRGVEQGALFDEVLQPKLARAERILALVDRPGANMAMELGYALGQAKPFALVAAGGSPPPWLDGPPFPDHLVECGGADIDVLIRVVKGDRWAAPPAAPAAPRPGARLLLCPRQGPGNALHGLLEEEFAGWIVLPTSTWGLAELAKLVGAAERVAWVVPAPDQDPDRDGVLTARNAIVAGWAIAHGRELRVFAHHASRPLLDVRARTDVFADVDELVAGVRAWLAPPPPPPPPPPQDPIALWRALCLVEHARLHPFQAQMQAAALAEVHVPIDVVLDPRAHGVDRAEVERAVPSRQLGLGDLMALRPPSDEGLPTTNRAGRWLIVADPGAGKSTCARYVTWERAGDADGPVAVYVPLSRLGDHEHPFDFADAELVGDGHPDLAGRLAAELRKRAETRGSVWLLLDGLDEVAASRLPGLRQRITRWAASAELAGVPIAVLTRPVAVEREGLGPAFREARLAQLDERRQKLLVQKLPGIDRDAVWAAIEARPPLRLLAGSPLMLTLTALVVDRALHDAGGAMPDNRVAVYDEAVRLLLERGYGRDARGMRSPDGSRALLARLSLLLQERGGECWERAELGRALREIALAEPVVASVMGSTADAESWLAELGQHGGVLGPHDGIRAPWRFLHRTLREFLAAEALRDEGEAAIRAWAEQWTQAEAAKRGGGSSEPGRPRKAAPAADLTVADPARWGEVYLLLCGMVKDPLPHLRTLRAVDAPLARRALPSADCIGPRVALDFLLGDDAWEEDDVIALAAAFGERLVEPLWAQVSPGAPLRLLAVVHYALTTLVHPPGRERFFRACGRWPAPVPRTAPIPAGSFRMGSRDGEGQGNEHPQHEVRIPLGFDMGVYPVTGAEWAAFEPTALAAPEDGRRPAVEMSWYEAALYCAWVGGRLPTEAEWEYACRAGTTTTYWSGDTEADLARVGWYHENSGNRTHPVGEKRAPNPWGLHEMHGNVVEWCSDWHGEYPPGAVSDPGGPARGSFRVLRGGSFWGNAVRCRSACRVRNLPDGRIDSIGFRVLLPRPAPPSEG